MADDANPWDLGGENYWDWTTTKAIDKFEDNYQALFTKLFPDTAEPVRQIIFHFTDEYLKTIKHYNKLSGGDLTLEQVYEILLCIGLFSPSLLDDFLLALFLYKKKRYLEIDNCTLALIIKAGICFLQKKVGYTLPGEIINFWLDGKAADEANLSKEFVSLKDADGVAYGTEIAYKPISAQMLMDRIGVIIYDALEAHYLRVVDSVCTRLNDKTASQFPDFDNAVLHGRLSILPEENTLQTQGSQTLYYEDGFNQDSRVDAEILTALQGLILLSEIEVSAVSSSYEDTKNGSWLDGWEVTFSAWRIRIHDLIDFHEDEGNVFYIQLDGGLIIVPDEIFRKLMSGWRCNGKMTYPKDYIVMADAWVDVDVDIFGSPRIFLPETDTCDVEHGRTDYFVL